MQASAFCGSPQSAVAGNPGRHVPAQSSGAADIVTLTRRVCNLVWRSLMICQVSQLCLTGFRFPRPFVAYAVAYHRFLEDMFETDLADEKDVRFLCSGSWIQSLVVSSIILDGFVLVALPQTSGVFFEALVGIDFASTDMCMVLTAMPTRSND